MDKRILIILAAVVLLLGTAFVLRMCGNRCMPPEVKINPEKILTGDSVEFTCTNCSDAIVLWKFGEHDSLQGNPVKFVFNESGDHMIEVITGSECSAIVDLSVSKAQKVEVAVPNVNQPDAIVAGEPATFSESTLGVSAWKWTVSGSGESFSGNPFTFTFPKAGKYTMIVEIAGKWVTGKDSFNIKVAPPKPAVAARKPSPAPRKEPVVLPPPAPKKAPLPAPATITFAPNDQFSSDFIRLANSLNDEEENPGASSEWVDKIVSQAEGGTMVVKLVEGNLEPRVFRLETFKSYQLTATNPWKVTEVRNILRGKKGAITEISITAQKSR